MTTENMTLEQLQEMVKNMQAENERLKAIALAKNTSRVSFKISEKGGVSVYGLGRFPVTLYRSQWQALFGQTEAINAFMAQHKATLDEVEVKSAEAKAASKAANEALAEAARLQRTQGLAVTLDDKGRPVTTKVG